MTTGYNICPSCKKKYSPKNESIKKINKEPICLTCFKKYEMVINYQGVKNE